jgi:hypothetical protein
MVFKDVLGFEGLYKVSCEGKVWSERKHRYLNIQKNDAGYLYVKLTKPFERKRHHRYIHIIVAQAFVPNPDNKPEVNHKDGIKANCHYDNLEWNTHQENIVHSVRTGLRKPKINPAWMNWNSGQLEAFENSPLNIKACNAALLQEAVVL